MKKVFLIALVITSYYSTAQIPYYDALDLSAYKLDDDNNLRLDDEGFIIINSYLEPDNDLTPSAIKLKWDNPFFGVAGSSRNEAEKAGLSSDGATSVGGLNVTNVADGLAKFLVSRTKQELSISFFRKFKEFLDSEKATDFKTLFPNTEESLQIIDKEIYQFSNYLNTLREAFEKDLSNILETVPVVISDNVDNPEKEYLLVAFEILNRIKGGVHPAEVFEGLAMKRYSTNLESFGESLKVFSVTSKSIKSKDPNRYWVSADSLNLLLNKKTLRIYLGLIYQQSGDKVVIDGQPLGTYLRTVATTFDTSHKKYEKYLADVGIKINAVSLAISDIKNKKDAGEKVDTYFKLFRSSVELAEVATAVNNLDLGVSIGAEVDTFIVHATTISNLYADINERKYNAAILDLSKLLTDVLGEKFKWNDELVKYGTFIANVAQAENSDDVQAAIEAIALPVGSASIKRRSKSNIALNAYLGLSPGYEYNGKTDEWKGIFGVHSPVGVAFSWGRSKIKTSCNCLQDRGSSSIFLSVIDISAFSTFRFNDDDTEELPKVNLSNIFAPGLYYVFGVPNVPLSLGLGGQMGPELREISETVTNIGSGVSISARFFISVDIPILNFYTKSL